MRSVKTIITYTCDGCERGILNEKRSIKIPIMTKANSNKSENEYNFCKECCQKLEGYIRLILHNEVPDRRGGYRTLGTYDG